MTNTRHYHTIWSMPGYLPDSDPGTFTSRRAAEAALAYDARDWREYASEGDGFERVTGNARDGYAIERRTDKDRPWETRMTGSVDVCYEPECLRADQ